MPIPEDLAAIQLQEASLTLESFSPETAWQLGSSPTKLWH